MIFSALHERVQTLFKERWQGRKRVHGLQGGARAYLLSVIAQQRKEPLVVITPTAAGAEELYLDLTFFLGQERTVSPFEKRLHLFPSWEILPFERLSPHPEQLAARLEGLYYLLEGRAPIVISTPAALMQRVIPKEVLKRSYLYLVAGEEISREALLEHLAAWGFRHVPLVEERGDFSVRGGIVDLFPPAYARPLRLEFFAEKLESIREFDAASQRSKEPQHELLVLPMMEVSLKRPKMDEVIRAIDQRAAELDVARRDKNLLLESLRAGVPFAGMEFLAPYFYPALFSVSSYLPPETLIWLDQAPQVEAEVERFRRLAGDREAKAKEEHTLVPPLDALYIGEKEWEECLASFAQIHSEALDILAPEGKSREAVITVKSYVNHDIHKEISSLQGKDPSLAALVARLREWEGEKVFFVAPTQADAARLEGLLANYGMAAPLLGVKFPQLVSAGGPARAIVVGELTQGFRLPEDRLILITSDEIFATKKRQHRATQKGHPSHFITSLSELKQDDYVVHLDHGIGIYRGLKFLRVAGSEGEFLHLEYEGGDRLYLPVDRINLVQKYAGGDGAQPALDRLGGTSWEKVKAKTRESILAMAEELTELYAVREVHEGRAFSPPDQLYQEFEAAFEFEETADQDKAIEEVLADMQRKKPMDRLVCGDVGYGKTEVALRAAFLAVMDGRQVAVLTPTTVLAQQHLQTFSHRFRNYPIQVEMLSRFLTAREVQRVLENLAKGLVDVVIGTHRLLQKDVQFKDLGLVVIDEEHRFGVIHKERLKQLRRLVDVISLTATPIPRTLHMSLVGIRDMSMIETPPLDRLAIQTYVTRYDEEVIRDAILRETHRGGQVFFLHNRVETIDRMSDKLRDLVPEVKMAVAHGQMRPRELERVMLDFLENRAQVLVCSAIIESGLDFPNANTIIVNRADKFGLAQLYQLRGRVGRSYRRAYAYLLIPGEKVITADAEKRLRALQELDELGGGFKLALHDLEIRGAGNLLGKQQSGHIAAVGLELYTQMMEKAVRELKGETVRPDVEPEIRLGISAYLPEEYIPDTNQRLIFYKRLAGLGSPEELEGLKEELRDRYGPFSREVKDLFRVMDLRRVLKDYLVEQISFHDGRLSLLFHAQSPVNVERLLRLLEKDKGRYRLSPDGRLSFAPENQGWDRMIPEVIGFLQAIQ